MILGLSFRADARRAVASLVMTVTREAGHPVFALAMGMLINAAAGGNTRSILVAAGLNGLIWAGMITGGWSSVHWSSVLNEKTGVHIDRRLMSLSESVETIEHHERPLYSDEIELLRQQRGTLASSVEALLFGIGLIVRTIITALLLGKIHPLLLVLPLFGLPSLVCAALAERLHQNAMTNTAERVRMCQNLFEMSTTAGPGKEIRIFGLGPTLLKRQRKAWDSSDKELNRALRNGAWLTTGGWLVFGAGFVAGIVLVVNRALTGDVTIGAVVTALMLASGVNADVSNAAGHITRIMASLKSGRRMLWLSDYARDSMATRPAAPVPVPDAIRTGIEFQDVDFRYPGTDSSVLSAVNLHIPAGSTVAIVGDNGAGKTSLVKLLCRYYQPSAGRITVDGIDLHSFDAASWRSRLSAGFQDFVRYELAAQHNVGIGELDERDDRKAVSGALKRAGGSDVVGVLAKGLDTQLGRSFTEGVDLSIGQWQKLALGRAMMRATPLILVLDEPTASLDAETEHALFERYANAASDAAASAGAITILVSHRFSTVRMADLIVVLDKGGVVESGSHEQLLSAGGLYAELFELQARAYR